MDKSRQQFEEWFKKEYETTMKDRDDELIKFVSDQLFIVWQASRKSLEIELPKSLNDNCDYSRGFDHGLYIFRDALISNGVKVK